MIGWVHVSIDLPADRDHGPARFWAEALGWPLGEPWSQWPEFSSFTPEHGDSYVHRQLVGGDPRVHTDLEVDDPESTEQRLVDLGASPVRATRTWRTLTSPGGLPFCLVRTADHDQRPAPIGEPGARSRLVQISIDAPAALHDREVEFWRAATGWRFVSGDSPEFAGKLYPEPGSSIQFLLQRLDPDDPGVEVRAHIDLGCDDREAEAHRLVALGAERLWDGDGWITLRDPAGLLFCATGNSPDAP